MNILAIDPGSEETAWVIYDPERMVVHGKGKEDNQLVEAKLKRRYPRLDKYVKVLAECGAPLDTEEVNSLFYDVVVVECPQPRGQPMYTQIVDTIRWIGRFEGAYGEDLVYWDRKDVKMCLCGRCAGVGDSNVRAAIISKFPQTGGGRIKQIGTKKEPGPLYGFAADKWAALGVALSWWEMRGDVHSLLS